MIIKQFSLILSKLLEEKSKEIGAPVSIVRYARFERGEGLEKKEENFAEEVAKMGAK